VGKHEYTKFDRARDEMMSHVIRCDVLDAEMEHRTEWLEETMQYMAERYPMLSDLELTKLEMIGKQFIKPPIPHGRGNTARTRDQNLDELVEDELSGEAESAESVETTEETPGEAPAPAGEREEEAGESELVVA
jgi:hypothetical protein